MSYVSIINKKRVMEKKNCLHTSQKSSYQTEFSGINWNGWDWLEWVEFSMRWNRGMIRIG